MLAEDNWLPWRGSGTSQLRGAAQVFCTLFEKLGLEKQVASAGTKARPAIAGTELEIAAPEGAAEVKTAPSAHKAGAQIRLFISFRPFVVSIGMLEWLQHSLACYITLA